MRQRSGLLRGEAGSATAELAVAMPAVALVLAASVGGVAMAAQFVRVQDAAASAAREAGRGEGAGVATRLVPGAEVGNWVEGDLACVRVSAAAPFGPLSIPLSATSCSLAGGQ